MQLNMEIKVTYFNMEVLKKLMESMLNLNKEQVYKKVFINQFNLKVIMFLYKKVHIIFIKISP